MPYIYYQSTYLGKREKNFIIFFPLLIDDVLFQFQFGSLNWWIVVGNDVKFFFKNASPPIHVQFAPA